MLCSEMFIVRFVIICENNKQSAFYLIELNFAVLETYVYDFKRPSYAFSKKFLLTHFNAIVIIEDYKPVKYILE